MRGAERAVAAGFLLAATALAGCTSGEVPEGSTAPSSPAAAESVTTYVALGDSFTAAPYVPQTDLAEGCLRSSGNYPALLAEALGAELTDVSCSGADTADVTQPQAVGFGGTTVRPQIEAVTPETDLVTVGIGGNDENLFASLVIRCTSVAGQPGTPCRDQLEATYGDPSATVRETGGRVADVLREVREAAPEATVVLVGYPRLVSAEAGCPALPVAEDDRPVLVALEEELDEALSEAARDTGAGYLDVRELSAGHEVCSQAPWVNGGTTDESRALAYHPFAEEQQAVADALEALLEKE